MPRVIQASCNGARDHKNLAATHPRAPYAHSYAPFSPPTPSPSPRSFFLSTVRHSPISMMVLVVVVVVVVY